MTTLIKLNSPKVATEIILSKGWWNAAKNKWRKILEVCACVCLTFI